MKKSFRRLADTRGISLVTAILALLILAVMAAVFFSFIAVESETSVSQNASMEAFFIADAGMEYAIMQLDGDFDWIKDSQQTDNAFSTGEFDVWVYTTDFDGSGLPASRRRVRVVGCVPDCDATPLGERSLEAIVHK